MRSLSTELADDLIAVHSSLDVGEVAKAALEACTRASGASAGAFYLADDGSTRLRLATVQGFSKPPESGDPLGSPEATLMDGLPPEMVVLLPMEGSGRLIGVIALHFRGTAGNGGLELAKALAGQSAIAVDRGNRYLQRRRATLTDELTGLANEHYMEILVEKEARRDLPLAYLMMALDHFKEINDSHGHGFGDQVLVDTAEVLSRTIPPGSAVAHHGGAAFGVLLTNARSAQAMAAGEALRKAVGDHPFRGGLRLTLSVGVAWMEGADPPSGLIAAADRGLHAAKIGGRNQVRPAPAGDEAP